MPFAVVDAVAGTARASSISCIIKSWKNLRYFHSSSSGSFPLTSFHSNNINTILYDGMSCGDGVEGEAGKKEFILSGRGKRIHSVYYCYGFPRRATRKKKQKEILDLFFDLFYYLFNIFPRSVGLSTFHFMCVVIIKCSCMRNIILCINEI